MRYIHYFWGSNSDNIIKKALTEMGHEVISYDAKCLHYTKDLKFAQGLINLIHECNAEAVISNDYFPIISMVCHTTGILYYSWVYDSPHYTLLASTSKYSCNRIGCFDRALVEWLNGLGIDTVKYLPLGVDWESVSDQTGINRYFSDVSFVGSLYTDSFNYYDALCDDYIRKRADDYIKKQCFEYKKDFLSEFYIEDELLSTGLSEKIRSILVKGDLLPGDEYLEDINYIFTSHFLEKKVTVEERHILLDKVAAEGYDLALYTGSDLTKGSKLNKANKGVVDYFKEMPYVFRNSRINLNITLRSIKTGIPLRALDIMGCGGFLLSNYQEELAENFREDKELVLYYSLDDCLEKIDYYLKHEEERKNIAKRGCTAVSERFNYRRQLEKLLGNT